MRLTRLKRAATGGAALALAAGVCAVIGLSAPAGAVNNDPAGNPTSPAVSYELDCTGSGLAAGQTAPFVVGSIINTTTDNATYGDSYGVAGVITETLIGPFIANLNSALNPATINVSGTVTFGSTDGNASGTDNATFADPTGPLANPGGQVTGVTYTKGSTTLVGDFSAAAVGDSVAANSQDKTAAGTIPQDAVILSIDSTTHNATISDPTTGADSAGTAVGYAPLAGLTFTDATYQSNPTAFTVPTSGLHGVTGGIGIIGASNETIGLPGLPLTFTPCSESGWVNSTTPVNSPSLPFGLTTPMVSKTQFQSGAFVNLPDSPPTPNSQSINIGEGKVSQVTLTATAGGFPVNANGFTLALGSPQTISGVVVTLGSSGVVSLDATAVSSAESFSFGFNACDTRSAGLGGPVCSTTPGTINVQVGTPPVIQPFEQQVIAGALVLSCSSPATYVTPTTPVNVGSTANPLLQCPEFDFPAITLNGLEQQVSTTTGDQSGDTSPALTPGTIYISDNRGNPADNWTFTGTFVPTAIGNGAGQNPNSSCGGIDAFCNADVGVNALNQATNGAHDGQIAPNYLQVSGISCAADTAAPLSGPDGTSYAPPNLNPDADVTTGGNFGSPVTLCSAQTGQSGGTFLFNATYTLTIPESVYAGHYYGSVQYTIQ